MHLGMCVQAKYHRQLKHQSELSPTKVWSCFAISALPDAGISSLNALSFQLGFVGAALKNRSQILISKDLFRTLLGLRTIVTLPFCSSLIWQLETLLNLHFCTVSWVWIFTLIALCKQTVQLLSPCNRIKTHRYALISLWKPLCIMFVAFVRWKCCINKDMVMVIRAEFWHFCTGDPARAGKHFFSSRRLATVVWLTYCAGWSLSRSYCGEWDSNTHWGLNCSAERIPRRRWFWRDVVVTIVGAGGRQNKGIKGQPDDCSALVRVASLFGTPYLSLRDPSQKESKSFKGSSREASNDPLALFAALFCWKHVFVRDATFTHDTCGELQTRWYPFQTTGVTVKSKTRIAPSFQPFKCFSCFFDVQFGMALGNQQLAINEVCQESKKAENNKKEQSDSFPTHKELQFVCNFDFYHSRPSKAIW